MSTNEVQILIGEIKCLSVKADQSLLENAKKNGIDYAGSMDFEISNLPDNGHEIVFKILQGVVLKGKSDKIVLLVESQSKFKIEPFNVEMFIPPVQPGVSRLILQMAQMSLANNSGMFCILKEDLKLSAIQLGSIPEAALKAKINQQLNQPSKN